MAQSLAGGTQSRIATDGGLAANDAAPARERPTRSWLLGAALLAIVGCLPLGVALGVLHTPRWYPVLDMAQIELLVRDIGSSHTPLVGPWGRIEAYGEQGHHPGPLSLYALWPAYKLLGSTAWALLAATIMWHLTALGTALWIGHRRGGTAMMLALAAAVAVLLHGYGPLKLTMPWNPHLALLWWVVFLLAMWSLLCMDFVLLPVAVFAGSVCLQSHLSYLALVGGLTVLMLGAVAAWPIARRRDPGARPHLARWGALSLGLAVVLWLPPVIEEVTNDPGNLSIIHAHVMDAEAETIGFAPAGVELWLQSLDPLALVGNDTPSVIEPPPGAALPGAVLLGAWVVAVLAAWRMPRHRSSLLRLHAVVGVALALGLFSMSRIHGTVWHYMLLWAWGTLALLLLAVGWTAVVWVRQRFSTADAIPAWVRWGVVALGALIVVSAASLTYRAASISADDPVSTRTLRSLAPPTIDALASGQVPGGGHRGRYRVTWQDNALSIPAGGWGMVLELDRAGFDVGGMRNFGAGEHRVVRPEDATATIHYVVGPRHVERWRVTAGALEVAYVDPRSPAQIAEYNRLHDQVVAGLEAAGLHDLVEEVDKFLLRVAFDARTPDELQPHLSTMITELGLPAAVFVALPDVAPADAAWAAPL